ncbi:MAG: hypothetical protein BroJett024_30840 [Alphaproteobacteria bacterium]|nr:MAG: hypothetical protein BroJett024_30840 [Alphaproteobacteria bacterium]
MAGDETPEHDVDRPRRVCDRGQQGGLSVEPAAEAVEPRRHPFLRASGGTRRRTAPIAPLTCRPVREKEAGARGTPLPAAWALRRVRARRARECLPRADRSHFTAKISTM